MIQSNLNHTIKNKIAVLILGGGQGTRLYPLTLKRSKPAVPFAGRYRLVDIALSRCIHARLLNLYVLTQYNSASLHLHINRTYRFDSFTNRGIQVLAASPSYEADLEEHSKAQWFLGPADAVRKTLNYYSHGPEPYEHYLILAGDQIHEIDLEAMLAYHLNQDADFTIAATPVGEHQLNRYGVLQSSTASPYQVNDFLEKPEINHPMLPDFRCNADRDKPYWGSMAIYLVKASILKDILCKGFPDFGKGVMPYAAKNCRMFLYPHREFFEDIGVFEAFFGVHIALAEGHLPVNLYHSDTTLYTFRSELPPALFLGNTSINKSIVVEGSVLGDNLKLSSSLIGMRSIIQKNCQLYKTYLMGNDFYRCNGPILDAVDSSSNDFLHTGIGENCQIAHAIIDKNCSIGKGSRIGLEPEKLIDGDYNNYSIRNGIVIIPKSSRLAPNTVI